MKNRRQKLKKPMFVLSLGVFFILLTIMSINNPINNTTQTTELDPPDKKIRLGSSHIPIHINNNWSDAKIAGICTGSGTFIAPYVIEDFEINGGNFSISSTYGIKIENTNEYFRIENTTINNGYYAIMLNNVSNGIIYDNMISKNYNGVRLEFSNNITVSENNISSNNNKGIYSDVGDLGNHTIVGNLIFDNADGGIIIRSDNNMIYKNYIYYNGKKGVDGQALDSGSNNSWDNGSIGNYWSDYYGYDYDGNGIGDIPYYLIGGDRNSQDNFPIYFPEPKPNVSITSHNNNDNVNGTTQISVSALSPFGIARIEFWINGFLKGVDNSEPYNFIWNTTIVIDDPYLLEVFAEDNLGQRNSTSITLNVNNGFPLLNITSHVNQEIVSGLQNIEVAAVSPVGIDRVEFWINGYLKWIDISESYNFIWNTTKVLDDAYLLEVVVVDFLGQEKNEWIFLTTNNGNTLNERVVDNVGIPGYDMLIVISIFTLVSLIIIKRRITKKNI